MSEARTMQQLVASTREEAAARTRKKAAHFAAVQVWLDTCAGRLKNTAADFTADGLQADHPHAARCASLLAAAMANVDEARECLA